VPEIDHLPGVQCHIGMDGGPLTAADAHVGLYLSCDR
jgi:hypothetical protein